jgi:hypothetical protein
VLKCFSVADAVVEDARSLQVVGGVTGSVGNVAVMGHLIESAKASSSATADQPLIDENLRLIEDDDSSDSVSDTCSVHSHNSLPSLASEPEDTCTPFRFLQVCCRQNRITLGNVARMLNFAGN